MFYTKIRCATLATKINKNISTSIWWLCWTVVHHSSVGLLSLTHASMDSDNHPITLCLPCSQSPPKALNNLISLRAISFVLRTLLRPSDSIRPMGIRFCPVVRAQLSPIRYASWAKHSHEAEVMGCWLLGMGYWRLAMGYWVLVMSYGRLAMGWSMRRAVIRAFHL